jgi:hypothetical protein
MGVQAIERESADVHRGRNIVVRASADYQEWLSRLSVAYRAPMSVVVDQAIARFAQGIGFDPPPRR